MLFNSGIFWVFFLVVLILLQINFIKIKSVKLQNVLLLAASYYFYGYWDWKFLGLIIFVTFQTYLAAHFIHKYSKYSKVFIFLSVSINLLILGYFKYVGFFVSEFLMTFDLNNNFALENIILPVGISFYIFQSFTYVVDVYFKKITPELNPINYATFIAFFPQLVAGPIERASSLLPQFQSLKGVESKSLYAGIKMCIIGLFLKVFIADNLASYVDKIFGNYQIYDGGILLLGALGFTFQIYGDFAGYSLIAIGVAKIMGFELMKNFNTPYFSTSIQDFWRRWHISLSSFFRDYVYIPLGGGKVSPRATNKNIIITFITSGLWHGANWTFIYWGAMHGFLLVLQRTLKLRMPFYLGWLVTMTMVVILWILFRSESISDFYQYMYLMITNPRIPTEFLSVILFSFYCFLLDIVLFYYNEQGTSWFGSNFLEMGTLSIMLLLVTGTIHDINPAFIYFQF